MRERDQNVVDEAKSTTRQIEHAKVYAVRHGWTVDSAPVYEDDGVSGDEFANRPEFVRLMNALKPHRRAAPGSSSIRGTCCAPSAIVIGWGSVGTDWPASKRQLAGHKCFRPRARRGVQGRQRRRAPRAKPWTPWRDRGTSTSGYPRRFRKDHLFT
jgi:hypothetical protein